MQKLKTMQKLKNEAVRVLLILIILTMISVLISTEAHAASKTTVNGVVDIRRIEVELTNDNAGDIIIINLFPNDQYFAEQFVGYNFVYPGLNITGDFIITNNSGQKYKVIDFSLEAYATSIYRIYNDAAVNKYGVMTKDNKAIVASLSGEEWYQLNADYYGAENFYDLDVARRILGFGDLSQGADIAVETSPELIALGKWYLFNMSQFSFNTDKYPINNLNVKNITLQDYIDKTSDNKNLVLSCFSQEIGEDGFTSKIGYSIDHSGVGNAYNGTDSDFKFTLTLSRVTEGVKLSYNGNGNTGGVAPIDNNLYERGSSVVVLDNIGQLVKEGFEFNGWNDQPDGGGESFMAEDSFVIDSDITLYALWAFETTPFPPTIPAPSPPPEPTAPTPAPPPKPTTPRPQVTPPEDSLDNLEICNHIRYIFGYPDGSIRPDRGITRSEAASIFFRLLSSIKNVTNTQAFDDVSDDRWYSGAVNYLAYIGVLSGYEDGTFRPDAPITRAEFAAIASKFEALEPTNENIFLDVPSNHWSAEYIHSAYEKGWINGYDNGTFEPENNITRAEVVKLVNTMLNRLVKPGDLDDVLNPFNDLTRAHWGYAHILEASLEHLYTRNDDGTESWNK